MKTRRAIRGILIKDSEEQQLADEAARRRE
jgi:hypothetical protein